MGIDDYSLFDVVNINVVTPVITNALDELVRFASASLAPYFGLDASSLAYPRVVLNRKAWFHEAYQTLALCPKAITDEGDSTLGHEVGHFLHWEANPDINNNDDFEKQNLCELVAHYCGRIFSSRTHPEIQRAKQTIMLELDAKAQDFKALLVDQPWEVDSRVSHYYSYRHSGGVPAAEYLFKRYGAHCLRQFALADLERAKGLLKELGFFGDLFVPHIPPAEHLDIGDFGKLVIETQPLARPQ